MSYYADSTIAKHQNAQVLDMDSSCVEKPLNTIRISDGSMEFGVQMVGEGVGQNRMVKDTSFSTFRNNSDAGYSQMKPSKSIATPTPGQYLNDNRSHKSEVSYTNTETYRPTAQKGIIHENGGYVYDNGELHRVTSSDSSVEPMRTYNIQKENYIMEPATLGNS